MNRLLLLFCSLGLLHGACAQKFSDVALYRALDQKIGQKNLGLNNGTIHSNPYRLENKTFRYLLNDYAKGTLFYDGQWYPEVWLKYDLLQDVVIVKLDGEFNKTGINLIGQKIAYFTLDGKNFVNLSLNHDAPKDAEGCYEQTRSGNDLELYTKHHKDRIETLKTDGAFSRFESSDSFILRYRSHWQVVRGENSVTEMFPAQADAIKRFYNINGGFRSTDPKQFMKDLVHHIAFLLQQQR